MKDDKDKEKDDEKDDENDEENDEEKDEEKDEKMMDDYKHEHEDISEFYRRIEKADRESNRLMREREAETRLTALAETKARLAMRPPLRGRRRRGEGEGGGGG